ncbi:NERD domain-containing protein/DEAD/DEAH box helicase [Streptomyces sp. NBC_00191]|uniref:nuclease-related domain-containing DEAD/DEAH box helicase n=1 Tax=Streptomyces sp. NBC_00191 TaxID=2975674 RepID=UPI003255268E
MIPPTFDPKTTSPGEREVFERLRDDPATGDWTALHSLGIAKHPTQSQGEADFVVLVPGLGVAVIEVKSHTSVARLADGNWKLGSHRPARRGPFEQADHAMHAIKNRTGSVTGVPFTSVVFFTNCRFQITNPTEWHSWQSIDTVAFHRRPISQLITATLKSQRSHLTQAPNAKRWFDPRSSEPAAETCDRLVQILRPSFDFSEPPKIRRYRRHEEVERFTQEQFFLLDMIAKNQRCVVEGAAGTGKTFIALEAARRFAADGARVLLCCYNRMLGAWLKEATATEPNITATHLHSYMRSISASAPLEGYVSDQDFHDEVLPDLALTRLLEEPDPPFDVLVIDECQDLMLDSFLDVFDAALRGGLGSGKWLFFGDFTNQAIYDSGRGGLTLLTARDPSATHLSLQKNCRNVPSIAQYVEISSNLNPGYAGYLRPTNDRNTEHEWWKTAEEQRELLAKHLGRLLADGFAPDEIVVLSPRRDGSAAELLSEAPSWARKLTRMPSTNSSSITFGTVHAFKGLDSPAVIVTDFESISTPKNESLFYIAASRARDDLTVLANEATRRDFRRIISGE